MAKRYSKRRPVGRNKYRKKRDPFNTTNTKVKITPKGLPMGVMTSAPFPPIKYCAMNYSETFQRNASGTAFIFGTEKIFRLNALFDPDFTGIGHQPYGFDTLATVYAQYKVHGVRIEIDWSDPGDDGFYVGYKIGGPGDTATIGGTNLNVTNEQWNTKIVPISATGSQRVRHVMYVPIAKAMGITQLQFKSSISGYSASVGADPANQAFIRLAVAANGVSTQTVDCKIKFTYYSMWFDRKTLAQS